MLRRQFLNHVRSSSSSSSSSSQRRNGYQGALSSVVPWRHQYINNNNNNEEESSSSQQLRSFHSTRQQEIVPILVVGGIVVMIGRYSWKALNRMDEEWEEYQWELQQYERAKLRHSKSSTSLPTTIGVDLGTLYLKVAHAHSHEPQPQLVVTSQGDRYRFQGVVVQDDHHQEGDHIDVITGRPALEKFLYKSPESTATESVVLPFQLLSNAGHNEAPYIAQQVIVPAVREALDRVAVAKTRQQQSQSEQEEESSSTSSSPLVRTVLTLPPQLYRDHATSIFNNYPFQNENKSNTSMTIPDPVAAIWGAHTLDLLPVPNSKEDAPTILVVDVGGLTTTLSIVQRDIVLASSTITDMGGETYVQQLVQRILKDASSQEGTNLQNDTMSLALIQQQARVSVMELVQKKETKVHIPFLFMGRRPDHPHMDMTVSRSSLEQAVQDYVRETVITKLLSQQEKDVTSSILSKDMPTPTDFKSLITSTVTRLLEHSRMIPNDVNHILVVGGGARHELMVQSCHEGIWALTGPGLEHKFVLPEASVRAELVALGAASLLPNYSYSAETGLERIVVDDSDDSK